MRIIELNEENKELFKKVLESRSSGRFPEIEKTVDEIVANVRENGDKALFEYSLKFDKFALDEKNIRVNEEEIEEAMESVRKEGFLEVLEKAAENIRVFHEKQKRISWLDMKEDGSMLGQKFTPIEKVGVYVPGGKAPLSSSVLMNLIPAKVAEVERIVMCTPPGPDGKVDASILAAARIGGATEIYRVGGAQAIAAMAYGTETIEPVYKICGPGNIFVALAKKAVYGQVGIDSIAGPSEILVLADETADARYVAADLLSQAEHGPLGSSILVTTSKELAEAVSKEVDAFIPGLSRRDVIEKSLEDFGYIFVSDDMDQAVDAVNEIATEHLEIMTKDDFALLPRIKNAGAIFLGAYSSEPLGDYFAGPDHILPTNGTAKFFSPLNVDDFVKKSSIISYSREALERDSDYIIRFAKKEGLTAHANSIAVRFGKEI
ncbi:MAG: histidinol dehydrogenase [Lachnospiraceae bacterium]|nr:histidinol dehydrogenase [Lachnospiraceae bacterium]